MSSVDLQFAIVLDPLLTSPGPIRIRPGLNVIYGVNGAGKTRLIEAISNALDGVASSSRLGVLVNANPRKGWRGPSAPADPATAIARSLAVPTDFKYFTAGVSPQFQLLNVGRARNIIHRYLAGLVPDSGPARDWILEHRLFLLIPTGTSENPRWDAWPVVNPSLEWVREEQELLDKAYAHFDAEYRSSDEADYNPERQSVVEQIYLDEVTGSTLFPAQDAEVSPASAPDRLWNISPFGPIGYGYAAASSVSSIIVSGPLDFGYDRIDYSLSTVAVTEQYFEKVLSSAVDAEAGRPDAERAVNRLAEDLSSLVSERLSAVLEGSPRAQLRVASGVERFWSPTFEWRFFREEAEWRDVGIDGLSQAEHLWAHRTIVETASELARDPSEAGRPILQFYDEPELGLHRSAESWMARALVDRAATSLVTIVAATHSPELLDAPQSSALGVERNRPFSVVRPLEFDSKDALAQFGLNPSDLLRLTRAFLLVEGTHDEVVLEFYFGERLRRSRVDLIPVRGGKKLPGTIDSRVLFDYTDAKLIALLDNTDGERVDRVRLRAQQMVEAGNSQGAVGEVLKEIGNADGESQFITSWLTRAIERGVSDRLAVVGLAASDIIEYLPVSSFVRGAQSWSRLRREHYFELETKPGTPKYFKSWLSQKYRSRFERSDIKQSLENTEPDRELLRLMTTIEALAG